VRPSLKTRAASSICCFGGSGFRAIATRAEIFPVDPALDQAQLRDRDARGDLPQAHLLLDAVLQFQQPRQPLDVVPREPDDLRDLVPGPVGHHADAEQRLRFVDLAQVHPVNVLGKGDDRRGAVLVRLDPADETRQAEELRRAVAPLTRDDPELPGAVRSLPRANEQRLELSVLFQRPG
jgi:hypothetical protein